MPATTARSVAPASRGATPNAGAAATDDAKLVDDPAVRFRVVEVAAERGLVAPNHCGDPTNKRYVLEEIGQGCALFDMDGDGDLDAYLVDACALVPPKVAGEPWQPAHDGCCRLYENDGHGRFRDVTEGSGAGLHVFGQGVAAADYDGDGDLDLYVTCFGPNQLLRNDGHGHFEEVAAKAGVTFDSWSTSAAFFDADGDQDLDLYVANYFSMSVARDPECWKKVNCPYYEIPAACGPKGMVPEPDCFFRNRGDGTFEDASESSGIRAVPPSYALGLVAFDYDQDGDVDVYVGNDSRNNYLFENDGHGRFTNVADLAGCSLSAQGTAQASMGIGCGDFDGDLVPDLFVTNFSHDDKTIYRNEGGGNFMDVTARHALGTETWLSLGWGTEFVDLDLDGDLDLFAAYGHVHPGADRRAPELTYKQRCRVYLDEDGRFRDVTAAAGAALGHRCSYRGAAFGDVDDDGDEDVLVMAQNEPPSLFLVEPTTRPAPHWLTLALEQPGMNRFAVGARVVAEFAGRKQVRFVRAGGSFESSSDLRLHFGLGAAPRVDRATVTWPDGTTQSVSDLPVDRVLRWRRGAAPEPRSP